ncbi:hypothetical protein OG196_42980 (plasmid) [Kitasatospora purpeofusca]|uniref:hypothetical protein n=1 Tax=Kitasatospora purpeofusca TaxID=67352 RepID=UPI002E0D72A7|nr:hypothetical protein OG196_42980 [Kitasatospora purpeofusca]
MTNVSAPTAATEPAADNKVQEQQELQSTVNDLLAGAGEAGRRAAGWVRELAARQAEAGHRAVLERAADALEQAAGREIVPGGDGQLDEELAYDLGAGVVTGSVLYLGCSGDVRQVRQLPLIGMCLTGIWGFVRQVRHVGQASGPGSCCWK